MNCTVSPTLKERPELPEPEELDPVELLELPAGIFIFWPTLILECKGPENGRHIGNKKTSQVLPFEVLLIFSLFCTGRRGVDRRGNRRQCKIIAM